MQQPLFVAFESLQPDAVELAGGPSIEVALDSPGGGVAIYQWRCSSRTFVHPDDFALTPATDMSVSLVVMHVGGGRVVSYQQFEDLPSVLSRFPPRSVRATSEDEPPQKKVVAHVARSMFDDIMKYGKTQKELFQPTPRMEKEVAELTDEQLDELFRDVDRFLMDTQLSTDVAPTHFRVVVLGGQWTMEHKGVPYDAV